MSIQENSNQKNTPNKKGTIYFFYFTAGILVLIILFLGFQLYSHFYNKNENNLEVNSPQADKLIQVEILNACGTAGAAEIFTNYLRSDSIDVIQTGNYITFELDNTLVIDRTGNFENAKQIASLLGVTSENTIQQLNKEYFLHVSILIGKDFRNLSFIKKEKS